MQPEEEGGEGSRGKKRGMGRREVERKEERQRKESRLKQACKNGAKWRLGGSRKGKGAEGRTKRKVTEGTVKGVAERGMG